MPCAERLNGEAIDEECWEGPDAKDGQTEGALEWVGCHEGVEEGWVEERARQESVNEAETRDSEAVDEAVDVVGECAVDPSEESLCAWDVNCGSP